MIGALGVSAADHSTQPLHHLVHRPSEAFALTVRDDRVVPIHGEDGLDSLESLLDLEDHFGGRDVRVVSGELPDLFLGTRSYGVGNIAMASGDLDSHMGLR